MIPLVVSISSGVVPFPKLPVMFCAPATATCGPPCTLTYSVKNPSGSRTARDFSSRWIRPKSPLMYSCAT